MKLSLLVVDGQSFKNFYDLSSKAARRTCLDKFHYNEAQHKLELQSICLYH